MCEMAKQTVSRTALGTATMRLIEQYQLERTRLFNDPVVEDLVGTPIRFLMKFGAMRHLTLQQSDAITKGIYGAQICRTRYTDDAVQAALAQGIDQIVILGAGLDTRPYRLPGIERVKVYEVDLPAVQADKKRKIEQHFGRLPGHVTFVPIDFDTQTLEAVLAGTTFDRSRPALFIWEGVTQYISEDGVRRTLDFVGKSAPGSSIVFTYVLKSIIERRSDIPNADRMMDRVAEQAPWIFGLEPSGIQPYLEIFHLLLVEDVGSADYQEKYLKPLGRDMEVFEGERIAHAVVG
jgi:methyltransferase (TIGR00027 family)